MPCPVHLRLEAAVTDWRIGDRADLSSPNASAGEIGVWTNSGSHECPDQARTWFVYNTSGGSWVEDPGIVVRCGTGSPSLSTWHPTSTPTAAPTTGRPTATPTALMTTPRFNAPMSSTLGPLPGGTTAGAPAGADIALGTGGHSSTTHPQPLRVVAGADHCKVLPDRPNCASVDPAAAAAGDAGRFETCTIEVAADGALSSVGPFQVQAYTQRCNHGDRIEVGERRFCGNTAPAGIEVSAVSNFTWRSDGSVGRANWTICWAPLTATGESRRSHFPV